MSTAEALGRGAHAGGPILRVATAADLPIILRHRRQMFIDMGQQDEAGLKAMEEASARYLKAAMDRGTYRGYLVDTDAGVVAGGGVAILQYPPSARDPRTDRPFIMNMYTEPAHRMHGYARLILEAIIQWCREQHFAWVYLHASEEGRPLYESLGFRPSNEMRLLLRPH